MLSIKDLEEFDTYMSSGELEKNFLEGSEKERYRLLELLEKLMDVAEHADELATSLIFRGRI